MEHLKSNTLNVSDKTNTAEVIRKPVCVDHRQNKTTVRKKVEKYSRFFKVCLLISINLHYVSLCLKHRHTMIWYHLVTLCDFDRMFISAFVHFPANIAERSL